MLSGFFSASETALTSANKIRLRNGAEEQNVKAIRSLKLTEKFDQTLSTILIGNNIVNIAMATIATKIATDMFGSQGTTIALTTIILTVIILVFGEILPKSLAKQFAEKFLFNASATLTIIMKLFYPVTLLFVQMKAGVNKLIGDYELEPTVTDDDVKALVEIGEEEGTFLSTEKELLHNAIEFDDIIVKDILTPRPDVVAISTETTNEEIKQIFIAEKFSRLPVFEGSIDNIIGIISHRDFFPSYIQDANFNIEDIMLKPLYVISSGKISNLLKDLQKAKVHLAVVVDEYGGTAGIISMEDIIEEIVGDIWDEHDESEEWIEQLEEGKVRLDGKVSIEEFTELFNVTILEPTSTTISGWISDTLGYLPKKGESMTYEAVKILIEDVQNRRIEKIIIEKMDDMIQTA
ncbi:hypothetical protein Q73_01030 [Bacillus coahuilensis m2-6]|uniref:Hemolysin n=2 Tax=Bacillus coahuilensis TaxID=408580 RepID=A0A147KC01_9BACI|nr:hemolysin family protein [Bacillus coahuilensis]KUP09098.1 hypothetical protein Q75_01260 [Bacillus coahuilensis p1.1.43]KUP09851.1 hypothetical protein Q73_01030 [Bacillus coahuilensis m2-6]